MKKLLLILTLLLTLNVYGENPTPEPVSLREQTEQALLENSKELISWAKESAKATGGFVKEQAPLVAKEYVLYTIVYTVIVLILSSLPFIAALFLFKISIPVDAQQSAGGMLILINCVISILALIFFCRKDSFFS